jgi:hypothetical protein
MILRTDPATPGDWTVVAVGDAVLAVSDRAHADDLAARLAGADGFRAALERLVSGGIAAAPDFALLDGSGGLVRVVLRGPAEVVAGAERVSGAGVTTWTERVLEQVGELRLVVPGSSWTLAIGGALPAPAPVVAAVAEPVPGAAPVPVAAPAPVAAPVATPAPVTAPVVEVVPEPVATDEEPEPEVAPAAAPALAIADVPVLGAPSVEDVPSHTTLAPPAIDAHPLPGPPPGDDDDAPGAPLAADVAEEPAAPAEDAEPYAFLFGDTVYRTIGGADVRIPNPDPERPGDHDGRTILVDELETHQQGELPSAPAAAGPALVLEMPGGVVEPLDAPLLVGRSPSDPGFDASGGTPRLVKIAADDKDISRTHARIEVAGGAVVVTDLDSKNGTSVTMPGASPRKLRAGEPAVVLPDTLIDLGGGVVMTVREMAGASS